MTPEEQEALQRQITWMTDPHGVLLWALALRLKNEQGQPLEWQDRRFLVELLCDLYPYQVSMKCSQIGLSTVEILKAYFLAQVLGRRIIYSLPSDKLVEDFSNTKLQAMERENPLIAPTAVNNVTSKSWDRAGFVLLRGTMGKSQDVMVTADYIMADEVNHSDIGVVEGLESRLQASPIKAQWWFGHPTFPGVGVDAKWKDSDQRKWHVACRGCGAVQDLDFWQNIDRERRIYVCRFCGHEISDDDRRQGEWIPTNPGARWHGYHISHLIAPWISAADVLEAEKKPRDYFFSKVLALPNAGGSGSVDTALVRQARVWPVPEGQAAPKQKFIGVDVGSLLHVVIGNEWGITKALTLGDDRDIKPQEAGRFDSPKSRWGKLIQLMLLERPTLLVIDNAPSGKEQAALQKLHPNKVLRAIYDYNEKRKDTWVQDRQQGTINAHRTRVIDEVLAAFADGSLPIYLADGDPTFDGTTQGTTGKVENCLVQHWGTLYQSGASGQAVNKVKKDRGGNVIRTWENAGPDHYAHATVYWYLAREAGRWLTGGDSFVPGRTKGDRKRRPEEIDEDDLDDGRRSGFFG